MNVNSSRYFLQRPNTDAPYLVGMVIRVMENNNLSLCLCHEK